MNSYPFRAAAAANPQKNLAFKANYASAIPWTGVEARYGGLYEISLTVGYLAPDPREIPVSRRTKYLNDTPNVIPALKRTGLF